MGGLFDIIGSGTLAVLFIIVVLVLLLAYVTGRFKVAAANEALVRTGGLVKARSDSLGAIGRPKRRIDWL